jgi:hypothetical protein
MKTKWMALMLLAGGTLLAQPRLAIGVRIGAPAPVVVPAPVAVSAYRPPCPGPGYMWIDGYYDEAGSWFDGYWTLPPYTGAYWIAPRLYGGRFYTGYWNGPRGYYRPAPRFAPRGNERHFDRAMPEHFERGFREGSYRDGGNRGRDYRGSREPEHRDFRDRGGNGRNGFRR